MEEIGRKLKTARTEKGYTLDDLQQITKIQKRYLIAIEEGNFAALPGDFYVRAFIKQYAETVGLDGEALLTQYQEEIPSPQPQPSETTEPTEESPVRAKRAVDKPNRWRQYLPQILLGVTALVVILGAYYVMIVISRNNRQTIGNNNGDVAVSESSISSSKKESSSDKESSSSSSSKKESDKQDVDVKVTPSQTTTQEATVSNLPEGENTLTVAADNGQAWVDVRVGGQSVYQGVLNAGEKQEVKLPEGVTNFAVQTGNATATSIKINDTKVDLSGGTRTVRTVNFTVEKANTDEQTNTDEKENTDENTGD